MGKNQDTDTKRESKDTAGSNGTDDAYEEIKAENSWENEKQELINTLQRLQADFENYKKRIIKEMQEYQLLANENVIAKMLPVLDNFNLAIKSEQKQGIFETSNNGFHLIFAELKSILADFGLIEIETDGKLFNPAVHEAMMTGADKSKKDAAILEEFQKGYMLGDKVLRHSKVKVNKLN